MKKAFEDFQTFIVQNSASKDGAISTPIVNSAAFSYGDPYSAEEIFSGKSKKPLYSRMGNPTNTKLENLISSIDGGVGAIAASSGMGAISMVATSMLQSGDEVICIGGLFGGSYSFFSETLKRFGVETEFISCLDDIEKFINKNTKMIFTESIGNPNLNIADFEKIGKICKENGILFVVDNTLTPLLFNPFKYGADIIVYSTTKIISGHSQSLGGAVVFRELNNEDKLFKNFPFLKKFYEKMSKNGFLPALKKRALRDFGMSESAYNSYLTILGLETLSLRVERIANSVEKIVRRLKDAGFHISHPLLEDNPFHKRYKKYFPNGTGAMFTIDFGSKKRAFKFLENSKILFITANIGDSRTLGLHMASTIYRDFNEEDKKFLGISEGLVRISIGLENPDVIIKDFIEANRN